MGSCVTFSTTAFSSARRWLAVAAVFALSLPPPAAASGFYAPSSTLRLPDAVLDAAHDVAYPSGTAPVRLSDYHHAKRDDGSAEVAADLFAEMLAAGVQPDTVTFAGVIDAQAKKRDGSAAIAASVSLARSLAWRLTRLLMESWNDCVPRARMVQ